MPSVRRIGCQRIKQRNELEKQKKSKLIKHLSRGPNMASSKSNQNRRSLTKKTTIVFPLPNATKPRYRVVHKTEINEFSDDLILSIFRYLSPIDLLNVGIICRRW